MGRITVSWHVSGSLGYWVSVFTRKNRRVRQKDNPDAQEASPEKWAASHYIALIIIFIYFGFGAMMPLIPMMIFAGSMEHLTLTWVPIIGTIFWLLLMARLFKCPKLRKQWFSVGIRYGVIAYGLAGLMVIISGLGTPGYVRKTEQLQRQMKKEADIAAIRRWAEEEIFSKHPTSQPTSQAEDAYDIDFIDVPPKQWPKCIKNISGYFSVVCYPEDKTVCLIFGGGFGHWGLAVAPKGTLPYGDHYLPLEDGAWVWHEIQ